MEEALRARKFVFELHFKNMMDAITTFSRKKFNEDQRLSIGYVESTLHALMDYWERLKEIPNATFSKELKEIMRAFHFANNKLKHHVAVDYLTPVKVLHGHRFPMRFPINFSLTYAWTNLDSAARPSVKADMEALQDYRNNLEGRDIRYTFAHLKSLLEKEVALILHLQEGTHV